jgi:hypothetical protein
MRAAGIELSPNGSSEEFIGQIAPFLRKISSLSASLPLLAAKAAHPRRLSALH